MRLGGWPTVFVARCVGEAGRPGVVQPCAARPCPPQASNALRDEQERNGKVIKKLESAVANFQQASEQLARLAKGNVHWDKDSSRDGARFKARSSALRAADGGEPDSAKPDPANSLSAAEQGQRTI